MNIQGSEQDLVLKLSHYHCYHQEGLLSTYFWCLGFSMGKEMSNYQLSYDALIEYGYYHGLTGNE